MLYRVHYCRNLTESHGFEWFSSKTEALKKLKEWWKEHLYDEEEEEYDTPWEDILAQDFQSFKVPVGKDSLLKFLSREAVHADNGSA